MKLLIQINQEIAQLSPDPFPLLRAGSGNETTMRAELTANKSHIYTISAKKVNHIVFIS